MFVNRGGLFFSLEYPESGYLYPFSFEEGFGNQATYGHALLQEIRGRVEIAGTKIGFDRGGLPAISESEVEDVGFIGVMLPVFLAATQIPDARGQAIILMEEPGDHGLY